MHYIRGKVHNLLKSSKSRNETQSGIIYQEFIRWINFIEGKLATSLMNLQEKYYKQISFTISSLIWAGILPEINIKTAQFMWKERNRFAPPPFTNGLGVIEYNILKNNIMTEMNLGTKDRIKGNIYQMKETEESTNSILVS